MTYSPISSLFHFSKTREPETKQKKTHILHHADSLLRLRHKLVLGPLNLLLRLGAQLVVVVVVRRRRGPADAGDAQLPRRAPDARLDGVERQARLLDRLARARRKHEVGVERRVPARQEAALDLRVLRQPRLAHPLHRQRVLFERRRQRVLARARVLLVQRLAARQTGPRDGVRERLGLRLGRGRCRQGRLRLGRRRGRRQQVHLFADGAAQVRERLLDVGRVVVRLVRVLRAVCMGGEGRRVGLCVSSLGLWGGWRGKKGMATKLTSQRASFGGRP